MMGGKKKKGYRNPVIRKLRIEFIAVMMAIVVVFLVVIFGVQYFSSLRSFENETRETLENALNSISRMRNNPDDFIPSGPNNAPPISEGDPMQGEFGRHKGNLADFRDRMSRTAVLVAVIDSSDSITVIQNNIFFINTDDVDGLIRTATSASRDSGEISDHSLKYMKRTLSDGSTAVALVDMSVEQSLLRSELVRSLWISASVIIAMFLLSLFLSRMTIRPVEKAWEDQRRFVADASHELKTPLTVIMSNTDMVERSLNGILESEAPDSDQRSISEGKLKRNLHRMENVREESIRMKELIGELLEVARGDVGSDTSSFQEISFSEITGDALLSWESVFYENSRKLTGEIEDGLTVNGDRTTLRRLVEILIDNALKYSSEHSETVIRLKKEKSGKLLHLTVTDEGVPLTQEEISHLFDRFYRADSSREKISGYGLGLSIASSITEAHGGKIWATSDEKTNSFHVTLPM